MSKVIRKTNKSRVDEIDVHIGCKLQEFREKFKITQKELGNAINVTFQQIQKYEKGVNRIHAEVIWKIASTFGIEIEFFFPEESCVNDANSSLNFSFSSIKYQDKQSLSLAKAYAEIQDSNVKRKITNLLQSIVQFEGGDK